MALDLRKEVSSVGYSNDIMEINEDTWVESGSGARLWDRDQPAEKSGQIIVGWMNGAAKEIPTMKKEKEGQIYIIKGSGKIVVVQVKSVK